MELKKLCDSVFEIFKINEISELKDALSKCVIEHDIHKFELFKGIVENDLSIDWLQKIFQYYEADRKVKKQDYTPKSISKLVGKLSKHKDIIDMCAGSGALTIQKWNMIY